MQNHLSFLDILLPFPAIYGHLPTVSLCLPCASVLFRGRDFFKNSDLKKVISHGFSSLVIPYFIFNLLVVFFDGTVAIVRQPEFSIQNSIIKPIIGIFLGSSAPETPFRIPGRASWFLMSLFCSRIFFSIMLHSRKWLIPLEAAALVLLYLAIQRFLHWSPFSIDSAILGLPLIAIGYFFKEKILALTHLPYYCRLGLIAALSLILYFTVNLNGAIDMFIGSYGNYVSLFLAGGISGSLLIILICSFCNYSNRLTRLIITGSTLIICMHMMIMEYTIIAYYKILQLSRSLMLYDKMLIFLITLSVAILLIIGAKKFCPRLLKL